MQVKRRENNGLHRHHYLYQNNKLKHLKKETNDSLFKVTEVTNGRICFLPHVNEQFVLACLSHWACELKS